MDVVGTVLGQVVCGRPWDDSHLRITLWWRPRLGEQHTATVQVIARCLGAVRLFAVAAGTGTRQRSRIAFALRHLAGRRWEVHLAVARGQRHEPKPRERDVKCPHHRMVERPRTRADVDTRTYSIGARERHSDSPRPRPGTQAAMSGSRSRGACAASRIARRARRASDRVTS